ncbi:glycosyltransferase family 9 protein [Mucispirillum schaedleri]|uniref:glycosyltransferase family 9 protein n=1 Tax=Mucispirillum schaedleri TaxID=248039 RepID=UPI001F58BFB2|nr:glycosyltransferase family 9 protein [Mucispirillum schaedleri]
MKVDTMRFVDKYFGVPLCLIGTAFFKIFGRPKKNIKPKNILFIELSEMGSAILVDPAMQKAKKAFDADLFFLIFKKNKPSLQLLNTVDDKNIFTINADGIISLIKDTWKFLFWARKRKIDTCIDLELFSRYSGLLAGFAGADNIVAFNNFHGEGLYKGNMVTHKVVYNSHLHISKNFIAMVNALMSDKKELPYSKTKIDDSEIVLRKAEISEELKEKVAAKIQMIIPEYNGGGNKLILINPNASELLPQRRWDKNKYKDLINRILEEYKDVYVLITGAPNEKKEAEQLAHQCGDRCFSFAGAVKFSELIGLYELSKIMITNDSGPAHFAAVTSMPTIVIFGPETPALYSSLGKTRPVYANLACSPCVSAANHRKTPCKDNVCLQMITVDEVFNVFKEEYNG